MLTQQGNGHESKKTQTQFKIFITFAFITKHINIFTRYKANVVDIIIYAK